MEMKNLLYDVIVIGGGPAGLTAGLYTSRARLKTLLIESPVISSQSVLTAFIENYPGFPEGIGGSALLDRIKKQAVSAGLEILEGDVNRVEKGKKYWKVKMGDREFESLSVIIAAGAQPKTLNIPGEEKFKGRGVSYCGVCDGAFFKDKDIVVIGGGDTALEEALFLTRYVRSIKLIHRRDKFRATKILQERVFANKKIEPVLNSVAEEIQGGSIVEGVKVRNTTANEIKIIPCSGIFVFVGYTPNTNFIKGLVDMDEEGYIISNDNMETSAKGIFACGDCRHKLLRQVVTACGEGASAAFSAQLYAENLKGTAYDFRT